MHPWVDPAMSSLVMLMQMTPSLSAATCVIPRRQPAVRTPTSWHPASLWPSTVPTVRLSCLV